MALDVHFINVGKGSCTLIKHPSGRITMIDIDDSRAVSDLKKALTTLRKGIDLTNPLDYLNTIFPTESIFRFILTHPDMDHLSGIKNLFSQRTISNLWDTENNKECTNWEGSPYEPEDWNFYQKLRNKEITGVTVLKNNRGAINHFWGEDGITILHPHPDLLTVAQEADEFDHISHVLKFTHAGKSLLTCGDATKEALEHMANDTTVDLSATVLLAPGHGSGNHVHEDAIKKIGHTLTIVSVAENVDYDRDFYSQFGPVLTTKYNGNIHLSIKDNGDIFLKTQSGEYSDQWYKVT